MVNSVVKSIQVNFRFIFYNRYGVREAYRSGLHLPSKLTSFAIEAPCIYS